MPSPLFTGDALYSAALLKALATTGESVITVVGASRDGRAIYSWLLDLPGVSFVTVPQSSDGGRLSYFSPLPRNAYWLATHSFRKTLLELLDRDWSWLVSDH